jgi:hypothetical protein
VGSRVDLPVHIHEMGELYSRPLCARWPFVACWEGHSLLEVELWTIFLGPWRKDMLRGKVWLWKRSQDLQYCLALGPMSGQSALGDSFYTPESDSDAGLWGRWPGAPA